MIKVEGGSRTAATKGLMTYVFTYMRNFLLLLAIGIGALRLRFRPWGWHLGGDLGLKTGILALEGLVLMILLLIR